MNVSVVEASVVANLHCAVLSLDGKVSSLLCFFGAIVAPLTHGRHERADAARANDFCAAPTERWLLPCPA